MSRTIKAPDQINTFGEEALLPIVYRPDRKSGKIDATLSALTWDIRHVDPPPLIAAPPGVVSLDFETTDPTIMTLGPAWAFDSGKIIGAALAWDGFSAYYPFGHAEGNVDSAPFFKWLKHHFERDDVKFVCANASYDIGWAHRYIGLYPKGGVEDVQFAAALLDEHRKTYSLDSLARDYLRKQKETGVIEKVMATLNVSKGEVMARLHLMPACAVSTYAKTDATLTLALHSLFAKRLEDEGLTKVHSLESQLIPVSVEMRRKGVRVDVSGAEKLKSEIDKIIAPNLRAEIKRQTGVAVDPWKAESIERALVEKGIECPQTETGLPSITGDFLKLHAEKEPAAKLILDLRKADKISNTFLAGHILEFAVKGRLHAQFNQLKSETDENDSRGTVSGRYSATNPALQQLPVRDPVWGPKMRSLILADEGHELVSLDYKTQEPRLALNEAYKENLKGAREAVEKFKADPNLDYYKSLSESWGLDRAKVKTIMLGVSYGMGGAKMARSLNLPTRWAHIIPPTEPGGKSIWKDIGPAKVESIRTEGGTCVELAGEETQRMLDQVRTATPYIFELAKLRKTKADAQGFVTTGLGRRCRFLGFEGNYEFTHKALNRCIQGDAAEMTKVAMLKLWRQGVCPNITLHDELIFNIKDVLEINILKNTMENAIKTHVPMVVSVGVGPNWGAIGK